MKRPARALVVDDHKFWRDLLRETLIEGDFVVDCVDSKAAALDMMKKSFYHLLVVDINLDDTVEDNQDGLELLRELNERGLASGIKTIILSAYGTMELMRESFVRYKVIDFAEKGKFLYDEFLEQVSLLLKSEMKINLDLEIIPDHRSEPKDLVVNLLVDGERVKSGSPEAALAAAELEDLLCRLFHKADQVIVNPLTPGRSGAAVLWALPVYPGRGGARSVVVKFGDRRNIDREYSNFSEYVANYIGGGRSTSIPHEGRSSTTRLGGIVYNFLGTDADKLDSFGNFYKHADVHQITTVIRRLFERTCSYWYANRERTKALNLSKNYQELLGFKTERLVSDLAELRKYVQGGNKLKFNSLGDRSFTNPLIDLSTQIFNRPTYVTTTHGDFNETNILVDRDGHSWLIDFGRTGEGHILRDVAELDSVVRLKLLGPEEAELDDRLKLEEGLTKIQHFKKLESLEAEFATGGEELLEQYLETDNNAVHKAFLVTLQLRKIAAGFVPPSNDDMSEYYIALLYNAVNILRFKTVPSIQRLHGLLSASLLTDRLAEEPNPFGRSTSSYS